MTNRTLEKSGTFLAIVVLNLALALFMGGIVLYETSTSVPIQPVSFVRIKSLPPPPKPPAKGGEATKSMADPTAVVVPLSFSPPTIVVSRQAPSSSFEMSPSTFNSMNLPNLQPQSGSGLSAGTSGGGTDRSNPFGDAPSSGVTGLMGELYDLKQTPDGKPTPMAIVPPETPNGLYSGFRSLAATKAALKVLRGYVTNWDQRVLDTYYKSPIALEAYQIFVPILNSEEATKAFHVADKVIARRWVIHYHATVIPPTTGRYRFIGFGDDFLVVRWNGVNVLDGGLHALDESANGADAHVPGIAEHSLSCGRWIDMKANKPAPMDILIGEGPGGFSGFFLLIEKQGDPSPPGDYPVFQIAPGPVPRTRNQSFSAKTMVFGSE